MHCLIKDPAEQLKIYVYFENSQTAFRGTFDSLEGLFHHKICLAIFGLVLGAIWKQKNDQASREGLGTEKIKQKFASVTLPKLTFRA